ncbi:MAG: hypothetical protein A3E84_05625 [Gammaproteobacteria bacterium RIFCSPHIGHO2_12_FULL_42_13]|nr:MAG: hypothetical protein A3E84_05625 [Gammaproteobacteria bacterium RIFCSPHIGHO2_12_FULL_42_13]
MQKAAPIDTLIHARWIVPIVPRNAVLDHHTIALYEGKILDILPTDLAKKKYQAKHTFNRPSHVVMPGLINAHAHTPTTLLRGIADDLPLMEWLNKHVFPAEAKLLSPKNVYTASTLAIAEMIRSGTTYFNDHYFYSNDTAHAVLDSGIRATIGFWVGDAPTGWAKDGDQCLVRAQEEYDTRYQDERITYAMAPHSPYLCEDNHLLATLEFSKKYNLPIHIHLHETKDEINLGLKKFEKRPIMRLNALGILDHLIAAHMVHMTPDEIQLCKEKNISVIHCPQSNLKLADGFAPINAFLNAGVTVALGTDGTASNNDLDMFSELRTASLLAKAVTEDPTACDAMTTLEMATINGAKAIGLDHKIGSLEIGKSADIITIDFDHLNTQPIYHPISHLVYAVNAMQVTDVFVAGKQLLNQGELTTINKEKIIHEMAAIIA